MRVPLFRAILLTVGLLVAWHPVALAQQGGANAVLTAEVFLDDPGLDPGTGTPLALDGLDSDAIRIAASALDLTGVEPGRHTLYLRIQDAAGVWSPPLSQGFHVPEGGAGSPVTGGRNLVVATEVFIDVDPGEGNGVAVPTAADGMIDGALEVLNGAASLAGLEVGAHVLHTRTLDSAGIWSQPHRQAFFVPAIGGGAGVPVILVAAEGIIDDGAAIALPADDGGFDDRIETVTLNEPVSGGYHGARIRFQDSEGAWSKTDEGCAGANFLRGQLIDSTTGRPLAGVVIKIDGESVQTDAEGFYTIDDLACGSHEVLVQIGEFETYRRTVGADSGGLLDIRLTKESTANGITPYTPIYGDPVNTATGNYIYQRRDLQIPGIGMPFRFDRAYNSRVASSGSAGATPLGYGWTHSYHVRLAEDTGDVTVTWGDGHTETHAPDGLGGYTPQYGVFDTLTDNGDGTFTLTKRDRTAYNFDTSGRLESIVDRNGNTLALTYTGANLTEVTDTAGRSIALDYDPSGRITLITDPIGRTVQYEHDANGDLIEATDSNGNLTQYTYDSDHQIHTVVDPRGNTVVTNTYDGANRVVTYQTDAKGNGTNFDYQELDRVTTVTDALGNVTVRHHDELLRLTREEDARGGVALYEYDERGNRIRVTDKNGNLTRYDYDARGNVTTKTDALGNVTEINYNADDSPHTRTDALGNVTQFAYDPNGNLTATTDALNQVTRITYFPNGLPETVEDPRGNVTSNSYDAEGNLSAVTNPLSQVTRYTYDGVGRLRSTIDALNRTTAYEYDENDNLRIVTDAAGQQTIHTYDPNDNKSSTTDRNGNTTRWEYDEKDLLSAEIDPLNQRKTYTYDELDRRVSRIDRRGFTTQYDYDQVGNLREITDPLDNNTTYTYDPNGNRLSRTDARTHTTNYEYDPLNRRTKVTDALNNETLTEYDALGRVVTLTVPGGRVTRNSYDELGRLEEVEDRENGVTGYTYDANGNRESMTDPEGNTIQYAYDELNRLTETTDALSHQRRITYDEVGNRESVSDALGHVTRYEYDDLNRLTREIDAESNATQTDYDPSGRITSVTDPNQRVTRFEYDELDRLVLVTDAAGGTLVYEYDENGNRSEMTDPNNRLKQYTYDELNRRISMTEPLGHVTHFEYDEVGNLAQKTDPKLQITGYAYDELNRRIGIDYPVQPDVSFAYDEVGNLLTMTDGLGTTTHIYDLLDRRTSTTDPFGKTVGYGYDANGNRTSLTYPGGETVAYVFDAADRLTTVTDWLGNVTTYSYDAADRLTGALNANGTTTAYGYDAADRLTGLTNARSDTSVINAYSYILDPVGNHLSEERTEPLAPVLADGTVNDTHDAENRLTASNGVPNSFDANGNLTAKGADTYSYDAADRLVETNLGGVLTQYQYDGLGNRYTRTRGGAETRFVLDTNTALTNVLMETDAAGNPLAYNVYGQGLIARILPDDSVRQYHYDSRGSTIAITDSFETAIQQYAYDPFGRMSNTNGTEVNPFGFLGRYGVLDEGGDLNFIRARYYDAEQQRFVSKDAKPGSDVLTQSLNRYSYSHSNPAVYFDISGYEREKIGNSGSDLRGSSDENNEFLMLTLNRPHNVRVAAWSADPDRTGLSDEELSPIDNMQDALELYFNMAIAIDNSSGGAKDIGGVSDFFSSFFSTTKIVVAENKKKQILVELGSSAGSKAGLFVCSPMPIAAPFCGLIGNKMGGNLAAAVYDVSERTSETVKDTHEIIKKNSWKIEHGYFDIDLNLRFMTIPITY